MKKNKKILERDIEQYLVKRVAKLGGKAYKFSSMSNRAVPDRTCYFPNGVHVLIELKAPGKKLTPLQFKVINSIRSMGHEVLVIDSKEMVDVFIESIQEVINGNR